MTSRGAGPPADLSTPLVSNRTLRTAAATVGSSRLPLRRAYSVKNRVLSVPALTHL